MRAILQAYLMKADMMVVTACSGEEALQKIQERKPDIIIFDILMPVMDMNALLL